jgi:hypothetical protein
MRRRASLQKLRARRSAHQAELAQLLGTDQKTGAQVRRCRGLLGRVEKLGREIAILEAAQRPAARVTS